MKKNTETSMRRIALFAMAFGLSSSMFGQTVFEAETATEIKFGSEQLGTALSGGKAISFCDSYGDSFAKYIMNAAEEGTYDIEFSYVTAQERALAVQINNQKAAILSFDLTTPNWDGTDGVGENEEVIPGILKKKVQVYLTKGDNTIKISAYPSASGDFSPNIDKFTVSRSASEITKPDDQNPTTILLEAEDANVVFGCVVNNFITYSGGKGIGDMGSTKGSYFKFNEVSFAAAGVYDVRVYYTTMDGRNIYTKANFQGKKTSNCGVTTPDWGNVAGDGTKPDVNCKRVAMYFNEGVNSLEIGAPDGWAPNVDKIVITKSAIETIDVPKRANEAFVFDFTDIPAKITEEHITSQGNWSKMFDNNDTTVYIVPGVTSAKITVELKNPILLTTYGLSTSPQNSTNVEDWILEYSLDGTNWENVPNAGSVADRNGYKLFTTGIGKDNRISAKFYRLTASGATNVEIGEFQLNGLPYLSETQHFPSDLTVDVDNAATGTLYASDDGFERGTWNEVFENSIDKKIDTKYTVVGKTAFYLQYLFNDLTTVRSYSISVPFESTDRNPKTWTLNGMNPETEEWEILDIRSDVKFPGINSTLMFNVENPKTYYYYKLDVTSNWGAGDIHLNQWQMFGDSLLITKVSDLNKESSVDFKVHSGKQTITITTSQKTIPYTIFTIIGQKIASGLCENGFTEQTVPSGIYIVQISNVAKKVIVK